MTRLRGRTGLITMMITAASGMVGCGEVSTEELPPERLEAVVENDGPEGDSELIVGDRHYPLDAALGNIWGSRDGIYQIDYTISNGNFQIATLQGEDGPYDALVPAQATAVVFASLFSPGEQFNFGDYAFIASETAQSLSAGTAYFTNAYVGLDENNNYEIEENERFDVSEGLVTFAGALPDIELHFSLTLSNGASVEGHYTGLFDFTVR